MSKTEARGEIKVGIPISYDYDMLRHSLPCIYADADRIWLAVDKNRRSWSGKDFEIPESFFEWLRAFDTDGKIELYEDDFAPEGLTPMECDKHERLLLHRRMGSGGWRIQLDSDEYFIDFGKFADYLRRLNPRKPYMVSALWLTLFKHDPGHGYFAISNKWPFPLASNDDRILRWSDVPKGVTAIEAPFVVLHETWSRSPEGLWKKLTNWSHSRDFDIQKFYDFWMGISRENYMDILDFHPLEPQAWHKLDYLEAEDIDGLIRKFAAGEYGMQEVPERKGWWEKLRKRF